MKELSQPESLSTNVVVKFVKEIKGKSSSGARQCLVKAGRKFYVVSSVHAMFSGFETLVFPADKEGNVAKWLEVAGGRGMSREEAIKDLAERLSGGSQ